MSLVWPNKDPEELLDYSIDWSSIIGDLTITNVVWSVRSTVYQTETVLTAGQNLTAATNGVRIDSIQNIQQALTGNVAVIYVAGGYHGVDYTFLCTITTSANTIIQRAVILRIRDC